MDMIFFKKNIDLLIIFILVLIPIVILVLIPKQYHPQRDLSQSKAQLRCLSGDCYVLPQESLIVYKLPLYEMQEAYFQDKVLSLGDGSELEISFPDQSKLIIRNTAVLKIEKGQGSLIRDLNKSTLSNAGARTEDENSAAKENPLSIIYIGNLPIEILYPQSNARIIPDAYPTKIKVTFRITNEQSSDSGRSSTDWELFEHQADGEISYLNIVSFSEDLIPQHYSTNVEINRPGKYILSPKGLNPSLSQNTLSFELGDRSELEERIQNLLDNYESSRDTPLEIRGP